MLIENQAFTAKLGAPPLTGDGVFRYCTFEGIDLDGAGFTGLMEGCRLERSQFYWGLFNTASLIDTHFVACTFPGTSFRGCRLVNCTFTDCRFVLDNLGGSATIDDCSFTECVFERCRFQRAPRDAQDVIAANNRFYGCHISACDGLAPR